MPYTPYTLQTILNSSRIEEPVPSTSNSASFFSRRPTSPTQETTNTTPTVRYLKTRIDSVGAWGEFMSEISLPTKKKKLSSERFIVVFI